MFPYDVGDSGGLDSEDDMLYVTQRERREKGWRWLMGGVSCNVEKSFYSPKPDPSSHFIVADTP